MEVGSPAFGVKASVSFSTSRVRASTMLVIVAPTLTQAILFSSFCVLPTKPGFFVRASST